MDEDLLITGTTVGDISYVVAYYDVNSGNLYDANGNMYGNSTLTTTLDNEFILELHYVQDVSTDSDPTTWAVWNGLEGKTVDSSLAFDSDYKHAYEGTATEDTAAASHEIKVTVSSVDKDTLNSEGNLIINPYGLEPEQIISGSTATPRMVVPYDSFEYVSSTISGTTFKFHVADADGLMYAVPADIQIRVSDPLYLYVNPSSIYEANIPPRYSEGVFKFPMNIMSRKLLKALDYTGATGVNGTLEHKISVRRDTLTGVSYNSNTYTRDKDKDVSAVYSGDTFLFCGWVKDSSTIWTKGNDVQTNTAVYSISNGTATLLGSTANPVTETDYVLFRTFAFPFLVKNLIDYNATIDIPMQDIDWAKDYIISIIQNNMEEITGKASTGAYGVVKIANDGTIDVNNGVISIATSLATKQDNLTFTLPLNNSGNTVSLPYGDGLTVGSTGTNTNKLIANEATVEETLTDSREVVLEGATESTTINNITDRVVEPHDLKGALSVGQAVDVSCGYLYSSFSEISTNGTSYSTLATYGNGAFASPFNGEFWLRQQNVDARGYAFFGFTSAYRFPKKAPNLRYLAIMDVDLVQGDDNIYRCYFDPNDASNIIDGVPLTYIDALEINTGFKRLAHIFTGDYALSAFVFRPDVAGNVVAHIKNWRQYEVTALSDEAIAYIAKLPNPDDYFRSNTTDTVKNKYLVKNDMVCPWIKTISMPDNSAGLTVGAGLSYQIKYTKTGTYSVSVDTIPADAYGWDAHISMFVKDTAVVQFQAPLILMDALTPNAGHNLSVKFRNGNALVYVDDTNAGAMVYLTTGTTTTKGSLPYALSQTPPSEDATFTNFVVFSPVLGGTVCSMGTMSNVAYSASLIGNGDDSTIVGGTIGLASGKYLAVQDLNLNDVKITSGTLNIGNNVKVTGTTTNGVVGSDTGVIQLDETCLLDFSDQANNIPITGASISALSGARAIPYGETESEAITAGTGNAVNKYGKCGYLVSNASGTGSGTLYDAFVGDGTVYSNIAFAPTLDGSVASVSTITIPTNKPRKVCGSGIGVTKLSLVDFIANSTTTFNDCTFVAPTGSLTPNSGYIYTNNCSFDNNTYQYQVFFVNGSQCYITNTAFNNCTTTNRTMIYNLRSKVDLTNCSFTNCICNYYHIVLAYDAVAGMIITDCYFNNPSTPHGAVGGTHETGTTVIQISGSTFASTADYITLSANTTLTFSGTNVINSTVSGDGKLVFAENATVTSTIPSGSTIGTGVLTLNQPASVYSGVTIENMTITNSYYMVQNQGFFGSGSFINCMITGNTCNNANGAIFRINYDTTITLIGCTASGNTTQRGDFYVFGGVVNLKDSYVSYISSAAYTPSDMFAKLNISGNVYAKAHIIDSSRNLTINIEQDSVVRGSYSSGQGFISVGAYDSSNTWVVGGTATIILLNGTTHHISGTGTYINEAIDAGTGLFTDLTQID